MSRKLKRVPLDFNWPTGQIWKGYVNPYQPVECKSCKGSGYSPEYEQLKDRWYGFDGQDEGWMYHVDEDDIQALIKANRLFDFTRRPLNEDQAKDIPEGQYRLSYYNGYVPTPDEVNAWARQGMGHDGLNAYHVISAKLERLGLPSECQYCTGTGHFWQSPEIEAAYEAWENIEPPTGDGYQLWENVTEGSPISPVFTTLNELCTWAEEYATTFANFHATAADWKKMLEEDFVHHQEGNITMM